MNTTFWCVQMLGLLPLLPLLAAVWIGARMALGVSVGDGAERGTVVASQLAMFLGGGALLFWCGQGVLLALRGEAPSWPETILWGTWLEGAGWQIHVSFLLDAISLPVATVVVVLGFLVLRFSAHYMHREAGFHRFFLILNVFLAGLLLVILSGNAVMAFIGWEMCGITSFLLIAYRWDRRQATDHAVFAFVTNRIGDAGFLLALGLAAAWVGSFEWSVVLAHAFSPLESRLLLLGFLLAAWVKSAQFPFTPWITRALEGPTPSSALFYGSLLIHLGVFLLLRLSPWLEHLPELRWVMGGGAVLTACYAWLCGQVQTDVKSTLIYATVAQVSLMMLALALGWTGWVVVHLCTHAIWRLWQFLHAPSWLMLNPGPTPLAPAWLRRWPALFRAAQQGFWLDRLGVLLLLKPTEAFGRDARRLEQAFIDPLVGMPGQGNAVRADRPLIRVHGLPGRLLGAISDGLQHLEDRLLLQSSQGRLAHLLSRFGHYLNIVEALLEQPRYLLMAVMATFVVIL